MPADPRILMLLANGFEPDPRVHKEATTLVSAGFRPTIICLDRREELPPTETIDGIEILRIRVGSVAPGSVGSVGLALPRFYLAATRLARKLQRSDPFSVIHCHDFDTVFPGLRLRSRLAVPLIYDVHDLYSSYFEDPLQAIVQRADQWFYRTVDRTIVVNDRFIVEEPFEPTRTAVIMNVPTRVGAAVSKATEVGLFYAGNMNAYRDMRYAMPVLDRCPYPVEIAGDGPLLEAHRAIARGGRILFDGRISPAEVTDRTARCRAVLALYDTSVRNCRLASPNKLFEAMKFGKPAIVSADSVMGDIVRERRCGVAVPYGDANALSEAISRLTGPQYDQMCSNAQQAFNDTYNWEAMQSRLVALYRELTSA